jgi:hypothetical protein
MEAWQAILTLYGGVLAWLALTNIQHMKKLAIIEKTLDGLVSQVNLFIKTEVDTLKELAKRK